MNEKQLRKAIEQLLESQSDNQRLRDNLEGLCRDPMFPGLTWFWGPRLYARNRAIFRPFILNHFSEWIVTNDRWSRVKWADHATDLEAWLQAARTSRDGGLIRRLQRWKYAAAKGWGLDHERWNAALIEAYRTAPTPAARTIVLDEFDDWFQLDEPTAIRLYDTDRSSSAFILKHLPVSYWSQDKRAMWEKLGALARAHNDETLYFALYRKLMPVSRWETEVLTLADAVTEQAELNRVLENRHLEGYGIERGGTVLKLLERRGRDVMPYVRAKLEETIGGWGRDKDADRFVELAERKGWWDLWSATARTAPYPKLFNECVRKLMDNQALGDDLRRERLTALAGVSREWNWPGLGLARIHALDDDLAGRVYARYPDLIRGPFRANVTPTWWRDYPNLIQAVQAAHDDDLVDTLASRYATRISWNRAWGRNKQADAADKTTSELAAYYQAIRDRDVIGFSRRASNVLTRIPAYATFNQMQLLRTNDLARLLFVRSLDQYLAVPEAVQDLVEGSNIHVMMLAYRVLALPDARARKLAAANVDILLGTLLRPIHRKTRMAAFEALANAARHDEAVARRIHARAREALKLPDKKYPKAELIGLIGAILAAHPGLAGDAERPIVYRHARAAA
jgi:phage tail protein X